MPRIGICNRCGAKDIVGKVLCMAIEICPKCAAEVFGATEDKVRASLVEKMEAVT